METKFNQKGEASELSGGQVLSCCLHHKVFVDILPVRLPTAKLLEPVCPGPEMVQHERNSSTHVVFHSQLQNLAKGVDGILAPDGVSFQITNMIVCGKQYSNGVIRDFVGK